MKIINLIMQSLSEKIKYGHFDNNKKKLKNNLNIELFKDEDKAINKFKELEKSQNYLEIINLFENIEFTINKEKEIYYFAFLGYKFSIPWHNEALSMHAIYGYDEFSDSEIDLLMNYCLKAINYREISALRELESSFINEYLLDIPARILADLIELKDVFAVFKGQLNSRKITNNYEIIINKDLFKMFSELIEKFKVNPKFENNFLNFELNYKHYYDLF